MTRRRPAHLQLGLLLAGVPLVVGVFGPLLPMTEDRAGAFTVGGPWGLGTDSEGRPVAAMVLDGGLSILLCATGATLLCYAVAVPWALTAASTRSRRLDEMLMRPLDVVMAVPSLMLLLMVATMAGPSSAVLVVAVAVLLIPDVVRILRAAALDAAHAPAMEMLLLQRQSWMRRSVGYLGRAVLPVLATDTGLRFVGAIYLVASASFLGLSADASGTDWAVMIDRNRAGFFLVAWSVVVPAALIVSLAVGLNLLFDRGVERAERAVLR